MSKTSGILLLSLVLQMLGGAFPASASPLPQSGPSVQPDDTTTSGWLIDLADEALYQAKGAGRNRYSMAG